MARSTFNKQPLIQVSVRVSPEAEDALSVAWEEVFGHAPIFYVDERTKRDTAKIFVPKKQWTKQLQNAAAASLEALKEFGFKLGKLEAELLPAEDWAESWKKHFKPIEIGNSLLIKPSWSKLKPKKNQQVIILDPGLSFGTGQHATTSFCLEQIVRCRKPGTKQTFLDIGTGSGILAIAAAKMGYSSVEAFDFDPESVRVCKENAEINGVELQVRPKRQDLTKAPLKGKKQYDVVCANLIYDLLIQEVERIKNRVKPGGSLVLAGILRTQFAAVRATFEKAGFKLVRTKRLKEWQSGLFFLPVT